jgi:adenylate cyclase
MAVMTDADRQVETLAIMLTDVEGSTALRLECGDVLADQILAIHAQILREELHRQGGQERQFLGDGFLFSFGTTDAAVACAIGIQRALEEHNVAYPEHRVRVRIGVHVGEVSTSGGELYGQTLHAAARVMSEAAGGQILVSGAVRDSVVREGPWRFVDSGLFWLKGFPERWRLYEVAWTEAAVGRPTLDAPPLTPLVERDPSCSWRARPASASPGWSARSPPRPTPGACAC